MNFLEMVNSGQWIVPFGILALSAFGGLHCISMCGPLCLGFNKSVSDSVKYHLARLVSYLILASIIFYFRISLKASAIWQSISSVAELSLLLSLLAMGGYLILKNSNWSPLKRKSSNSIFPFQKVGNFLARRNLLKPAVIGFVNGFIPCGWLYSFLIVVSLAPTLSHTYLWTFCFWFPNFLVLILLQKGYSLSSAFSFRKVQILFASGLILFSTYRITNFKYQKLYQEEPRQEMHDQESCH
ncbi:MAG: sulfite exporter TauE/SafE family protein [Bdellovibrionota bacterium]|nr:sulfite exporter TauE/SafE family protein [Bdellovibrionota bacterium]